ncbi:unnamed protein product [Ilex paraguariensis]|uniref:WRKY domain-containing protein n=1 Tax=Ilex paraguariensis TaxID=185542 RepID=A0ABC8RJ78_9AQUA
MAGVDQNGTPKDGLSISKFRWRTIETSPEDDRNFTGGWPEHIETSNYFRCIHRFDQGCQATKQVQITEDELAMYHAIYRGVHTCHNLLKAPQIILDSTITKSCEKKILLVDKLNDPFTPFLLACLIEQEQQLKEGTPSLLHNHHQPSSWSQYFLSLDLRPFEVSGPPITTVSAGSIVHRDVISFAVHSSTANTHGSFEMDMMVGSVDFDDVLTE